MPDITPTDRRRSWTDEELVLALYGEADADILAALADDLAADAALAERHATWRRTLELVSWPEGPERGADYGQQVWARLAPRLAESDTARPVERTSPAVEAMSPRRPARATWPSRWLPLAVAATLLVALGFLLGRLAPSGDSGAGANGEQVAMVPAAGSPAEPPPALSAAARERILAAALAGHLERAERLLVEVANGAVVDPDGTTSRAAVLLAGNRLYRTAAEQAGARDVARLLVDVERLLLELAHLDASGGDAALAAVGERLREADMLFKLRVVETRMRRELRPPSRVEGAPRSPTEAGADAAATTPRPSVTSSDRRRLAASPPLA